MLDFIEQKGLVNVIQQPDGITCACPVCRGQGHDQTGNHLKIFRDGKFHCIRGSAEPGHNAALYNLLYKGESLEIIFTPVEPKTKVVKVYDESILLKLLPDYSYWVGRGISESTLKLFGGGVAPLDEKSKLSERYCFPVRDDRGQLIGFAGRLLRTDQFKPKWKNLMPQSLSLWPIHVSKQYILESKTIVIVESIGDSLSLWERGIRNTIVCFGLNFSSKMLGYLVGLNVERIIISTNNDKNKGNGEAGNRAAATIKAALLRFFDEERVIIHLPVSNDWGAAHEASQDAEFAQLKDLIG